MIIQRHESWLIKFTTSYNFFWFFVREKSTKTNSYHQVDLREKDDQEIDAFSYGNYPE